MKDNQVNSLSFQGDRARYPFKLRDKPLVTIPVVVAVLYRPNL